jgi:outer membrane protein assembly factor BamA
MTGIGAGLSKNISANTAITFSIGYRYQQIKITSEYNAYYDDDPNHVIKSDRTEKFNRIALSVGIKF